MTFHVSSAGTKCNGQKDYKPWYSLLKETHNMLKFGSSPFASDPSGQLNVLGHDGHPLGVDSLQAEYKKQSFFFRAKYSVLTQRLVSSNRPTR